MLLCKHSRKSSSPSPPAPSVTKFCVVSWDGVADKDRKNMLLNDPVTVARHFSNRWNHFLKWILSDEQPVGKITDYFWRVEFQRRGSPHIHMMAWVEGAPNLDTGKPQHHSLPINITTAQSLLPFLKP